MSASVVSIVVPAWGPYAGPPLDEAIASLREQEVESRIIVVDNASDPPVTPREGVEVVRSEERLTLGAARNLGLEQVTSPYVMFWDADDLLIPGALRVLVARIAADPGTVAVAAQIVEGDPPRPHGWPRRWTQRLASRSAAFAWLNSVWSLLPTTGATLIRTEAAREAGGFGDSDTGEDWVIGASLGFRGRVAFDDAPGRLYRRHSESLWESHRSPRHLTRHAGVVRQRLARDPAVPRAVRLALPGIAAAQWVAIYLLRPMSRLWRRRAVP